MVPRSSVGPRSFGFRSVLSSAAAVLAGSATLLFTLGAEAQQPTSPPASGQARPSTGAPTPAPASGTSTESSPAPVRDDLIPQDPPAPDAMPQVDPAKDQQKLVQQGRERPTADGTIGARPTEVYSEDWWSHTRPIIELHGYFRTRGELFHNFALGRHDSLTDSNPLWQQPVDNTLTDRTGQRRQVLLCGNPNAAGQLGECYDKSQAHANLRLRLNPEIHISDNLRVLSQIDLLDNLVLGSTPETYAMRPNQSDPLNGFPRTATGYSATANGNNGYAPLSGLASTQGPPTAGVNGYRNSIDVQRAWAEYLTPVGQVRFGRMPNQWGLGMVMNSGDCLDCDYQSNVDRIMFVSGVKPLDLYFGGSWDFVGTGPTSQTPYSVYGGQPYNTANLANVGQWSLFAAHRTNPERQRLKLARGEVVVNGGIFATYRKQLLDVADGSTPTTIDTGTPSTNGLQRRGLEAFTPDAHIQLLYDKLRLEAEVATVWGSVENYPGRTNYNEPLKLRMFGYTTQAEFRAVEDKLRIGFGHGWASGDPNVEGLAPDANGVQNRLGGGAISTFRFHPAYYVDYIFFRRILSRIEGAYYFRPSVEYDFIRNPNGQKFGGGAAVIWSRASEFVQTPGNKRDLGVELDAQIYYQAKDGSLNDDPNKMGGFYAALQWGLFVPLGDGLAYMKKEQNNAAVSDWGLSAAQSVRLILGVLF